MLVGVGSSEGAGTQQGATPELRAAKIFVSTKGE